MLIIYQICFTNIGYRTYIIFAVICAFAVPLVFFTFPETRGRSLEEMHEIFSAPVHWWNAPGYAKNMPVGVMAEIENANNDSLAREQLGKGEAAYVETVEGV